MRNPYLELTREFNDDRLRVLRSSGQAVVVHRLAVTSKDGDWIVREDAESVGHVLAVLGRHGARYRFGAPLDVRWLAGGWSSHFEFLDDDIRVRTDFVSRPPRIAADELAAVWRDAEARGLDVVPIEPLAAIKLTDREKDYAVVGELARRMTDVRAQFFWSRSARDLIRLAKEQPAALADVASRRPLLRRVDDGRDALDEELDRERRAFMRVNEERLARYRNAGRSWAALWPSIDRVIAGRPLAQTHAVVAERATGALPFTLEPRP